jgi:hypothetical protein
MRLTRSTLLCLCLITALPSTANAGTATVPFVGCPSDGQVGPDPAPTGKPVPVALDAQTASRLAFYQSKYDNGILAPRGWHCANLEGSNGWILFLASEHLNATALLDPKNHPLKGPAIQFTVRNGGTSGRFEVAQLIARYFPQRRAFLKSVIAEGIEPAGDFPSGPFKADQLVTRRKDLVEYLTPAGRKGLGTKSRLIPSDLPIRSFAAVVGGANDDWAGFTMAVRLPKDMDDLAPVILSWAERRYATGK